MFDWTPPGYKYWGPGNRMDKGLPTNDLDAAAYKHDKWYDYYQRKGFNPYVRWNEADERLRNYPVSDFSSAINRGVWNIKKSITKGRFEIPKFAGKRKASDDWFKSNKVQRGDDNSRALVPYVAPQNINNSSFRVYTKGKLISKRMPYRKSYKKKGRRKSKRTALKKHLNPPTVYRNYHPLVLQSLINACKYQCVSHQSLATPAATDLSYLGTIGNIANLSCKYYYVDAGAQAIKNLTPDAMNIDGGLFKFYFDTYYTYTIRNNTTVDCSLEVLILKPKMNIADGTADEFSPRQAFRVGMVNEGSALTADNFDRVNLHPTQSLLFTKNYKIEKRYRKYFHPGNEFKFTVKPPTFKYEENSIADELSQGIVHMSRATRLVLFRLRGTLASTTPTINDGDTCIAPAQLNVGISEVIKIRPVRASQWLHSELSSTYNLGGPAAFIGQPADAVMESA